MARPSSAFIDFEIVGNRKGVEAMLHHLDSSLSVVGLATFLHGAVQPWLLQRAKERFANQGDDVTGKWAPLQAATIEFRAAGGHGPAPINVRTRELEEYITQANVDVVSTPEMAVLRFPGRNKVTRSIQQKMQTAQRGRANPATVARPVLGVNERDLGAIMSLLAFHVQGHR